MALSDIGTVKITYFATGAVGGRGGQVRFQCLALGVQHEDESLTFADWPPRKTALIESGDNPCGAVPVVKIGDRVMHHSLAVMRYICSATGAASSDPYVTYMQDALADECIAWRSAWVGAVFAPADKKEANTKEYVTSLSKRMASFEAMYTKFATGATAFAGGGALALHGDACVFAMLYDDRASQMATPELLAQYPKLSALYAAVSAVPTVAAWIAKVSAKA